MRKGLIIRDPEEDVDEEPEADEVKLGIEAALAAASSLSIQQLQQQVKQLKQQLQQQQIQIDGEERKPGVKLRVGEEGAASSSSSSSSTSNKRAREEYN
jgi:transcriptional regulator of heat shock response